MIADMNKSIEQLRRGRAAFQALRQQAASGPSVWPLRKIQTETGNVGFDPVSNARRNAEAREQLPVYPLTLETKQRGTSDPFDVESTRSHVFRSKPPAALPQEQNQVKQVDEIKTMIKALLERMPAKRENNCHKTDIEAEHGATEELRSELLGLREQMRVLLLDKQDSLSDKESTSHTDPREGQGLSMYGSNASEVQSNLLRDELMGKLALLERKEKSTQESMQATMKQVERAQDNLARVLEKNDKLEEDLGKVQCLFSEERKQAQASVLEMQRKLESAERQVSEAKARESKVHGRLEETQRHIVELQTKISDAFCDPSRPLQRRFSDEAVPFSISSKTTGKQFMRADSALQRIEQMKELVARSEKCVVDHEKMIEALCLELEQAVESRELAAKAGDQRLIDMQKQKREIEKQTESFETERVTLQEELDDFTLDTTRQSSEKNEAAIIEREMLGKVKLLKAVQQKNRDLFVEYRNLKAAHAKHSHNWSVELKECEISLDEKRSEAKSLRSKLAQLEENISSLQVALRLEREALKSSEENLARVEVSATADSERIIHLERQEVVLQKEASELQASLLKVKNEVRMRQRKQDRESSLRRAREAELEEAEAKLAVVKTAVPGLERDIAEAEKEKARLHRELEVLMKSGTNSREKLKQVHGSASTGLVKYAEVKAYQEDLTQTKQVTEAQIAQVVAQVTQLETQRDQLLQAVSQEQQRRSMHHVEASSTQARVRGAWPLENVTSVNDLLAQVRYEHERAKQLQATEQKAQRQGKEIDDRFAQVHHKFERLQALAR